MDNLNIIINKKVNVAYVGCLHGGLTKMYYEVNKYEKTYNKKIDLVICCGDFQVNFYYN